MYVMMVFRFVHINLNRTVSFDVIMGNALGVWSVHLPLSFYLSAWLAG